MFKLKKLEVKPFEVAIPNAIANARQMWNVRRGVFLQLHNDHNEVGVGEASPVHGLSHETFEECVHALKQVISMIASMESIEPTQPIEFLLNHVCANAFELLAPMPSARFAFETALCDLMAQHRQCSIAQLFCNSSVYDSVPINGLIDAEISPEDWPVWVERFLRREMDTCKIKIGRAGVSWKRELNALVELRRCFGQTLNIRLDVNGVWPLEWARDRLNDLVEVNPEYVEQPVASDQLVLLGRCAVPWAADESLMDPHQANLLLQAEGCSTFVIKPTLVGGLVRSLNLAQAAFKQGLSVTITHAFESPIGYAAACELAMMLPQKPLACGLDRHSVLDAFASTMPMDSIEHGTLVPNSNIGLRALPIGYAHLL